MEKRDHWYIPVLKEQLLKGRIERREFLRTATLLGLSAGAAYGFVGMLTGDGLLPRAQAQSEPKRGGNFRVAMPVQEMVDPATFDWVPKSNVARHIVEYLTMTGPDNITRPYLAEGWEASDDLTSWTFHLRKEVFWSNGDPFTADDVIYNFTRWLDPAVGSSNAGLFDAMLEEVSTDRRDEQGNRVVEKRMTSRAIEKVDNHTLRFRLNAPVLSVPENLYNYPTAIVHRRFAEEGGDLSKNPIGTGPYELAEFEIGKKAVLKRRDAPYWGSRVTDDPYFGGEVYLDQITYIDKGLESEASLAALAAGEVDGIYEVYQESLAAAEQISGALVSEAQTAQTGAIRMQVTQKPFNDPKVRAAIVAASDNAVLLEQGYADRGVEGGNHHVAPIHPEYYALPRLRRDLGKARELLAEAGHGDGLRVTCNVGNTNGPWQEATLRVLAGQLAGAGITLELNVMSAAEYWQTWKQAPLGLTAWTHRPLGTMALSLAYRTGVPWNETNYANPKFDAALDKAESLLDVGERTAAMKDVEQILRDDHIMIQPFFQSIYSATDNKVRGYRTHPTLYHQFQKVWIK
ncbi:MAG: ABC transporter substrate-binding protein [Pseudomonadota bacterium]